MFVSIVGWGRKRRHIVDKWVTKELAEYATETRFEDYPPEVIDRVKILILDSIGCMFGGCQTNLGKAILAPIKNMGGSEEATLVGGGARVPTIQPSHCGSLRCVLTRGRRFLGFR